MTPARTPCRWDPSQGAEKAARDIIASFDELAVGQDRVRRVFDTSMAWLGIAEGDAIVQAGRLLAGRIDGGDWNGHPHAYHNVRHFCEVMLGVHFVASLQGLSAPETAEVVLAAMMHDVAHDGGINAETPFRLERQSIDSVRPVVEAAGLAPEQWHRLAALVLATDTVHGHPYAIACHRHHDDPSVALPETVPRASEMALFAVDAQAVRQALVLCEADVLPSVGLTPEYATALQDKLSAEWNRPLGPADKLNFIDFWSARAVTSLYFKPNVEALRLRLLLEADKGCR